MKFYGILLIDLHMLPFRDTIAGNCSPLFLLFGNWSLLFLSDSFTSFSLQYLKLSRSFSSFWEWLTVPANLSSHFTPVLLSSSLFFSVFFLSPLSCLFIWGEFNLLPSTHSYVIESQMNSLETKQWGWWTNSDNDKTSTVNRCSAVEGRERARANFLPLLSGTCAQHRIMRWSKRRRRREFDLKYIINYH